MLSRRVQLAGALLASLALAAGSAALPGDGMHPARRAAGDRHQGKMVLPRAAVMADPAGRSHAGFPAVVAAAMRAAGPMPAGSMAPIAVPAGKGAVSAQTSGLGGAVTVTLVATPSPLPDNSPQMPSPSRSVSEIASFSTTAAGSPAAAAAALSRAGAEVAACGGPSVPAAVPGTHGADICQTVSGGAVEWTSGTWQVQVSTLGGARPSEAEAATVASLISGHPLPAHSGAGIVSVQVPAGPQDGSSVTAAVIWRGGSDFYQVRSLTGAAHAIEVASAMRAYP